ncbi:MAG: hypothetical protein HOB29_01945 [Planctomycetaceae bacterium]|jgi:hypothetical protein|nr:hypothetical protein [Planctomycetaceae bacterium]MBT7256720.1 hypothetical protein [Planctomycetaceae bacterium]
MIYYLGELIECGELNVTSASSIDGWLKLVGETEMIRFELNSIEVQPLIGCQMKFAHNAATEVPSVDESPKYSSPAVVDLLGPLQTGRMITLKLADIVPDDFDAQEVRVRRANGYRGRMQLVWKSEDGLIDITISDCEMDVAWENTAANTTKLDAYSVANDFSSEIQEKVVRQLHQARAFGESEDHPGEYLLSLCMPSNEDLTNMANFQAQTMLHRVEDEKTPRLVEFMGEISQKANNIPVYELIEPPIQTPKIEEMSTEQLQAKLVEITRRLRALGIEFKACEHFDDAHTYDWIVNRVIAWEHVHPKLKEFKMRRCFDSAFWCDECKQD